MDMKNMFRQLAICDLSQFELYFIFMSHKSWKILIEATM